MPFARGTARRSARPWSRVWFAILAILLAGQQAGAITVLDGITFAAEKGALYVPVDEAAQQLGWRVSGENNGWLDLNRHLFQVRSLRRLIDGPLLVSLGDLALAGAQVGQASDGNPAVVASGWRRFGVRAGSKRVEINLSQQVLRAYQGERLVLASRISSGRPGWRTPSGSFTAGPYKARMHYSSLFDRAPMPWSVQVTGHVFIHGFTSVPPRPASHGCIRLPLSGGNPAKWFYEWIDVGTPILIEG